MTDRTIGRPRRSVEDRFFEKVQKGSDCWLWTAKTNGKYGQFYFNGWHQGAHRVSWMLHRGPIPDGLHVCHTCDTPLCVRPDHLFVGTSAENMRDCVRKRRFNKPQGEEMWAAKQAEAQAISIRALYSGGKTLREISAELGVPLTLARTAVEKWRHLAPIAPDRPRIKPTGERHPMAKLTEADVLAIRRLRSEGRRVKDLAQIFGISEGNARDVISGRSWSHLPV